ncbi:conserved hypothetical protein [Candidatus Terasakiella magnetica]|nr:conserved hypothetical protein [Candidatus Terasakiella magnetica]
MECDYDAVPYWSYAHSHTDVAHLQTIGRLFALPATDFRKARVLELGCASGGNLIPMAARYPQSRFLGIDLSEAQVAAGRADVAALGLGNIEIRCQSILDFPESEAGFDYIIAHGILSWVPPEVQDGLLDLIGRHLAPNGIALVSYNVLPGWNMVRSVRDMLLYHCKRFAAPAEKAVQARLLLRFMAEQQLDAAGPLAVALRSEIAILDKMHDSYLLHDHLEQVNDQFYVHELMERAGRRGLAYLGDADIPSMVLGNYPEAVQAILGQSGDMLEVEQYLDFINNRRFRNTLLCRAEAPVDRLLSPERIATFHIRSHLVPETPPVIGGPIPTALSFRGPGAQTLTTSGQVITATLLVLWRNAVRPVSIDAVLDEVARLCDGVDAAARQGLLEAILRMVLNGALSLHADAGDHVVLVSERPEARPEARFYAAKAPRVPNARHEFIDLDLFEHALIGLLDGTRDRAALAEAVTAKVVAGELVVHLDDVRVTDPSVLVPVMAERVEALLQKFAQSALLHR